MNLYIIDAIGPFFKGLNNKTINWSKIPFDYFESSIKKNPQKLQMLYDDFNTICQNYSDFGYNAITIDDVVHITGLKKYSDHNQLKIRENQEIFKRLFEIAQKFHLSIYLTSDAYIHHSEFSDDDWTIDNVKELYRECLIQFPSIAGVIIRIGECDGVDVKDDYISKLNIKNIRDLRKYLIDILPVFEEQKRKVILRTWTVGAFAIGDLIWNKHTFEKAFKDIDTDSLILSMKYGESDFFRYLPLNRHFFQNSIPKIIEMQTRREYEGCGEYPASIGRDYQFYFDELLGASSVIGLMVWCQTGGWTRFKRLSFLENSSLWTEINTYVAIKMFKDRLSFDRAIRMYHQLNHMNGDWLDLLELMDQSEKVIKELMYLDQFARKKIFFRRLRIPPLLTVYWDRIRINSALRKILSVFCDDGASKVIQGFENLKYIEKMKRRADNLHLPTDDIDFMYATFEILAWSRAYYLLPEDPAIIEKLQQLKVQYKFHFRHRSRYSIHIDHNNSRLKSMSLDLILRIFLREKRGYRYIDHLITIKFIGWFYPILRLLGGRFIPSYARQQAMGIDVLFK